MIHLLALVLLAGCSSLQTSREELRKLSVTHSEHPVADAAEAERFLEAQRKYLVLLKGSPLPEICVKELSIGPLQKNKEGLAYNSTVRIDKFGSAESCEGARNGLLVWDFYVYCHGDKAVTNYKISKKHLPAFKGHILCN